MPPITDDMLMAYLDGELDEVSSSRVSRALAQDPQLSARADAQRRLKELISRRYDPVAQQEVPERFRALIESNVVPLDSARLKRRVRIQWPQFAAMAATFVVGLLAAQIVPGGAEPAAVDGGPIVARGALAEALDTQLASAPPADAGTRIGVSFASEDGRFCRTFETADLAGLACRGGERWELVTTARTGGGGGQGEYRQAGSGAGLVLQYAQEMMAGEPLDEQAERRARDRGWRSSRR
ncbi:MAG: anti-sigma factor [Pseudomonadota bacterium]|nr:anti-sigma factor [Pseudomonadota bacterium]